MPGIFVWFGLDFSRTALIGRAGFPDPDVVKDRLFGSWNDLIVAERKKYDIPKYFGAANVTYDLATARQRNALPDPSRMVVDSIAQAATLDVATVKTVASAYRHASAQGTGVVFVVESLNKNTQTAIAWVVEIDLATSEIRSCSRVSGKARGIGLRNFWAYSFYEMMKNH